MNKLEKETDLNFDTSVTVVKFGAVWCGPCKKMEPTLAKLVTEFTSANFVSVDVDKLPSLGKQYQIRTVPSILFFKDGVEKNRVVGLSLIEPLRKILRDLVKE